MRRGLDEVYFSVKRLNVLLSCPASKLMTKSFFTVNVPFGPLTSPDAVYDTPLSVLYTVG